MLFLGSLIFGGAIFLAAQMYNTRVYWPDGFLWWALGSLAAARALEIAAIRWLAVFVGFAAFGLVSLRYFFARDLQSLVFDSLAFVAGRGDCVFNFRI